MGGAAIASLVGGMGQGYADAQRRKQDDEYKKLLLQQAKTKIELESREQDVLRRASEGDQSAIRELVIKKNPILGMIMGGNGGQAPPETNVGMNYEEPTAPQVQTSQVRFPGSMTGLPQGDIVQDVLRKDLGIGVGREYAYSQDVVKNGQIFTQKYSKNNTLINESPSPKENYDMVDNYRDPQSGQVGSIKVNKFTNQPVAGSFIPKYISPVQVPVQGPGGEKGVRFVDPSRQVGPQPSLQLGQPQQTPSWNQLSDAYAPVSGGTRTPPPPRMGGLPGGAMQTEPPESAKFIPPEKLGDYYNPLKGQYLSDHPDAATMTHGERQKQGYVEVPKISPESAGKFTGAVMALDEFIPRMEKEFYPQGKFNQQLFYDVKKVASSNKLLSELGGDTPGVGAYKDLIEATEAWVRAKTGAAMTKEEIEQAAKEFIGPWLSSGDAFKRGINNLKSLLGGYAKGLDPKGVARSIETRKEQMIGDKKAVRLNGVWGWVD